MQTHEKHPLQQQHHQKTLHYIFFFVIFFDNAAPTAIGITLATIGRLNIIPLKYPLGALNTYHHQHLIFLYFTIIDFKLPLLLSNDYDTYV